MTETLTVIQRVRAEEPDLLEALLTAAGDHLAPVVDVGRTAGGDLLLVLPAPAARLTDLLQAAGWPTPGEAVTVLVPLAQALQRLHHSGVAIGGADAAAVVLDADGSPSWSPTAPVLLRRTGPIGFAAAVEADRAGFARLAEGVTARAGVSLRTAGLSLDELVAALFDLAEPNPVRLVVEEPLPAFGPPARLVPPATVSPERLGAHRLDRLRAALPRIVAPLRTVRRRVWVAAGAVAAALIAALLLLPGGGSGGADAVAQPAARPSVAALRSVSPSAAGPVAARELSGVQAVPRLLSARAACLASGQAACLDQVDAPGSPARTADVAAIAAGTDPALPTGRAEVLSDGGGTVVARVGGAVVVATREQHGWRLRDVVAEPPR